MFFVVVAVLGALALAGATVRDDGFPTLAQRVGDGFASTARTARDSFSGEARGGVVSGPARVVDGDTLEVRGTRVRLYGIDAPETAQRCRSGGRPWSCGREATRALAGRVGSRAVACESRDQDRYGRIVAVCRVAGEDVNAWMVVEGWAFAYRQYSMRYVAEETAAKVARRGIWQGDAVPPWDWRRGTRLRGAVTASRHRDAGCAIKGNISRDGTRIYHVPGGRFYDRTRIDGLTGERWFCSEAEARVAGWRRSRR